MKSFTILVGLLALASVCHGARTKTETEPKTKPPPSPEAKIDSKESVPRGETKKPDEKSTPHDDDDELVRIYDPDGDDEEMMTIHISEHATNDDELPPDVDEKIALNGVGSLGGRKDLLEAKVTKKQ